MSYSLKQKLEHLASNPCSDAVTFFAEFMQEMIGAEDAQEARFDELCQILRTEPALCDAIAQRISDLLAQRRHRHLYSETGVLEPSTFGQTLRTRLASKLLPHPRQDDMLRDAFALLFKQKQAVAWVNRISPERWTALFTLLIESPALASGTERAAREADQAMIMLAARAAGLAVDTDRVRYMRYQVGIDETDALALPVAVHGWIEARAADPELSPRDLLRKIGQAQAEVEQLRAAAPRSGTSVALAHSLHAAAQTLQRLRQLVLIRSESKSEGQAQRCATLFVELVEALRGENSVRAIFSHVTDEVSQRITQHASKTGEHYVTDNRAQWKEMFRASAGAGVIVGFMALLKIFIANAHMAPLWETLSICLNYGLGFVLIHLLHFTVATKQPAMTATLLAARLTTEEATPAGAARLADLVVRMVRTQVVAIIGNVALAIPTALLIFYVGQMLAGHSLVPVAKAEHMLADLRPLHSWALIHAAIAGTCLFFSGVVSGYYDNLSIYGKIEQRIAEHPFLSKWLGKARSQRLATYLADNLGALAGNLSFGFMLGGMGFIGFLSGLPIDVRHVALSSANLAFSFPALSWQMGWLTVLASVVGLVLVGCVNLGVSFALAFITAIRAHRTRFERARLLLRLIFKRLIHHPKDFVWPPRDIPATDETIEIH